MLPVRILPLTDRSELRCRIGGRDGIGVDWLESRIDVVLSERKLTKQAVTGAIYASADARVQEVAEVLCAFQRRGVDRAHFFGLNGCLAMARSSR
ncbi:MAG: hypothetical protein ACYSUN_01015 [Planctomycetota bacterium]|jgi:hypothetical protein